MSKVLNGTGGGALYGRSHGNRKDGGVTGARVCRQTTRSKLITCPAGSVESGERWHSTRPDPGPSLRTGSAMTLASGEVEARSGRACGSIQITRTDLAVPAVSDHNPGMYSAQSCHHNRERNADEIDQIV